MNEKFYQVKDGYKRLAIEICFDTAKQYKSALRALINDPWNMSAHSQKYICEKFLLSNKYGLNLNFEKVIEKIKEEVGYIGSEE